MPSLLPLCIHILKRRARVAHVYTLQGADDTSMMFLPCCTYRRCRPRDRIMYLLATPGELQHQWVRGTVLSISPRWPDWPRVKIDCDGDTQMLKCTHSNYLGNDRDKGCWRFVDDTNAGDLLVSEQPSATSQKQGADDECREPHPRPKRLRDEHDDKVPDKQPSSLEISSSQLQPETNATQAQDASENPACEMFADNGDVLVCGPAPPQLSACSARKYVGYSDRRDQSGAVIVKAHFVDAAGQPTPPHWVELSKVQEKRPEVPKLMLSKPALSYTSKVARTHNLDEPKQLTKPQEKRPRADQSIFD